MPNNFGGDQMDEDYGWQPKEKPINQPLTKTQTLAPVVAPAPADYIDRLIEQLAKPENLRVWAIDQNSEVDKVLTRELLVELKARRTEQLWLLHDMSKSSEDGSFSSKSIKEQYKLFSDFKEMATYAQKLGYDDMGMGLNSRIGIASICMCGDVNILITRLR